MIRDPDGFPQFLESLRRYVREQLAPREAEVARLDEVPQDLVAGMAAQGLFGYSIPEAYGGAGMTTEELILAAMELSQCSVAFRARVGTNTGIGSEALVADGTEAQKARYLPRLASGELTPEPPAQAKTDRGERALLPLHDDAHTVSARESRFQIVGKRRTALSFRTRRRKNKTEKQNEAQDPTHRNTSCERHQHPG